jgi:hypothetical protein
MPFIVASYSKTTFISNSRFFTVFSVNSPPETPFETATIYATMLRDSCATSWKQLQVVTKNAAIYADDFWLSCIKCTHTGGLAGLDADSLTLFPPPPDSHSNGSSSRAVFFISDHLSKFPLLFCDLLDSSTFAEVYIVSAMSELSHVTELEYDQSLQGRWSQIGDSVGHDLGYFGAIEHKLMQWMRLSLQKYSS